jgi:PilZ domain-containing protein
MAGLPTPDPRAKRFPLRLALQYRADIFGDWQPATTENISLSGVLFRTPKKVPHGSAIDIDIQLPEQISGPVPIHLLGRARVVRSVEPKLLGERRTAAEFVIFRLPKEQGGKLPSVLPADAAVQHHVFGQLAVLLGSSELLLERRDVPDDARSLVSRIHAAAKAVAADLRHLIR